MKIVVAPDSFKESLDASEVCAAIAAGVREAVSGAEIVSIPMADGGEGTAAALVASTGGSNVDVDACGPQGESVTARYGLLGDGATAVVEMASASGLPLVPVASRNPGITTTFGTGELIRHALDAGVRAIIVAIGGSATNDGGAGMAQALGFGLLDGLQRPLARGGLALSELARIEAKGRHGRIDEVAFVAACDVDTPLLGPEGASHVFGPQKGADAEMVSALDRSLSRFTDVVECDLGVDVRTMAGGGAAGGLGAGLVAFTGAALRPGFEIVAETCGLESMIAEADLVITGEGCLDGQSVYGKTPVGVARLARKHGVPVIALAGRLGEGYESCLAAGISEAHAIAAAGMEVGESMERAAELLEIRAKAVLGAWVASG